MRFDVEDAARLSYAAASFDVIVDKAMLDAVEEAPGSPYHNVTDELYRVLKPGGTLAVVSLGP